MLYMRTRHYFQHVCALALSLSGLQPTRLLCPWHFPGRNTGADCQSPYPGFPGSSDSKESVCHAGDPSSILGSGRSPGDQIGYPLQYSWASLVAQMLKSLPIAWETCVRSLGWEESPGERSNYPLQYSGLENSMNRGAWQATVLGSQRVRHY